MLVLTRKVNEAICLGDAIRITVVEIKGTKVRLGIEAPQEVTIRRGELPSRESFGYEEVTMDLPAPRWPCFAR